MVLRQIELTRFGPPEAAPGARIREMNGWIDGETDKLMNLLYPESKR